MNALTTIEPAQIGPTFDEWLAQGQKLLADRKAQDWRLADHLATGQRLFPKQIEMHFIGQQLGMEPKFLTSVVKAAEAFPESNRDTALTLEHHIHAASLPEGERLSMLKKAHEARWTPKQMRKEVMRHRVAIGHYTALPDDDPEHHLYMSIVRAWNNAPSDVRETFMQQIEETGLEDIDG